jgi:3',5'-cyclic AMP phosphodiesterase CpdA
MNKVSRRKMLAGMGAGALGVFGGKAMAAPVQSPAPDPDRRRVLRLAHMTDFHVQPEDPAPRGMEEAVQHMLAQPDKPELLVTGGDLIMHATEDDEARVRAQWDIYHRILDENVDIPIRHTIGNHDVWGWPDRDNDPRRGKVFAQEELELEKPYYSFDQAGWHFVVLDSTHQRGGGYVAKLDDEQFEWLKSDLAAQDADTPVMVISHQPIISFCPFFDGDNESSGNWQVTGAWMHIDARRIKDAFYEAGNVKLAVSGHIHLADRVDYLGTTYYCNGAVSGGWWGGKYQEFAPAYGLVNLYDDGSFDNEFVTWAPDWPN